MQEMDQICVDVKRPDTNEEQRTHKDQDKTDADNTEEKLIGSHKHPWKPWKHGRSRIRDCVLCVKKTMVSLASMEWYCYALLGMLTALISFFMDVTVTKILNAHQWLYGCLKDHHLLQFLCWTLYPACLCALSTGFSHSICPSSAGSGVPEVRAIILGMDMPDYLSLSNLFAKVVGLTCTLASGSTVFLGKVGPFVHLSTMVGAFMNRLHVSCRGGKQNVSKGEMLVVASAVGVASCFGAPISGVLFSIEVMGSHYSVRDYCPCFFAAACGAITFRLLSVCSRDQETIQALFKTSYPAELPFQPFEIFIFALVGLICGFICCFYLYCHRWALRFVRTNKPISRLLATEKAIYSAIVAFLLACFTFYHSAGRFIASELTMKQLLSSLLDATSWYTISQNSTGLPEPQNTYWQAWNPPDGSYFKTLGMFILTKVGLLVVACTLPLPAGYFMPVFIYGAAVGRFVGEVFAYADSDGKTSIDGSLFWLALTLSLSWAQIHSKAGAVCASTLDIRFDLAMFCLNAFIQSNSRMNTHEFSLLNGCSVSYKTPHPQIEKCCPRVARFLPKGRFCAVFSCVFQATTVLLLVSTCLLTTENKLSDSRSTCSKPSFLDFISKMRVELFILLQKMTQWIHRMLIEIQCYNGKSLFLIYHKVVRKSYTFFSFW
ncbi:Chloride channel protein [Triplophysa tibetana]|uniref:Chloride channel protein n=1 Tax=Triplophysa tibetana TaxID=1572043 RepID=A0A5A9NAT1_9TELE|nr:Chloride channel protein [Triplophysa tibetana]